jgi:hypothetical protein
MLWRRPCTRVHSHKPTIGVRASAINQIWHVDTTIIKLVDVQHSNSMIEAFWRIMKTNWLYLNKLDSFAAVERQVNFYIDQYNRVIPHSAHSRQTPDEIYFKTGTEVPSELQAAAVKERRAPRSQLNDKTLSKLPASTTARSNRITTVHTITAI